MCNCSHLVSRQRPEWRYTLHPKKTGRSTHGNYRLVVVVVVVVVVVA